MNTSIIQHEHRRKLAYVYLRQSTLSQVRHNQESTERQYALRDRAQTLGWSPEQIVTLDGDLGLSGTQMANRPDFKKLVAEGATELPITDARMTRFWITLQQGMEFVTRSFARMYGGEIFVPKIPSMRILDLAESIAPGMPTRVVGIRPGEKLHEIMCPADDCHLTLEFPDHYVIKPSIRFIGQVDYAVNGLGEQGKPVAPGFEYNSGSNPQFLGVDALRRMNET